MSTAIQKQEPGQVVPMNESASMMAMIAKASTDPNVDIEKMERLWAMKERMDAKAAETEFNAAMSALQAKMGRIGTDKTNRQTNSNYATYAKLDRALRPLYTEAGFALSFGTEPSGEAMVRVICDVSHQAGHSRRYAIDMPADGKGAKGNDVMTKTHATGSATQYGMRYLLKMIFNVAIGDEDDDGNAAGGDTLDTKASDWIRVADGLQDPQEYKEQKAKLLKDYNGAPNLPQPVRDAFNRANARVTPKD